MKTIITSLIKKIERVKKEQEAAKKSLSCASAMLEVSFTEVTQAKWIECHEKVQELKTSCIDCASLFVHYFSSQV